MKCDRLIIRLKSSFRLRALTEHQSQPEIIEDYPNDRPLPSYLILGFAENQKPIHAVVAIDVDEQIIWVITVYSPSLREWEDGYKRRKTI